MFIAQLTKSAEEGGNGATLCYIGDIVGLQVLYCKPEACRSFLCAYFWPLLTETATAVYKQTSSSIREPIDHRLRELAQVLTCCRGYKHE